MYYHNTVELFKGLKKMDTPGNLVGVRIRISPRIRSQNRNGLKGSVRDLGHSDLCKNIEKTGSLPFKPTLFFSYLVV